MPNRKKTLKRDVEFAYVETDNKAKRSPSATILANDLSHALQIIAASLSENAEQVSVWRVK